MQGNRNQYFYKWLKQTIRICTVCLIAAVAFQAVKQGGLQKIAWQEGLADLKQMEARWIKTVWRRAYPAYQTAEIEEENHLLQWLCKANPVFRYQWETVQPEKLKDQLDPSYERYAENKEFLREHQYLLQYGTEDTNLTENPEIAAAEEEKKADNQAEGETDAKLETDEKTETDSLPAAGKIYALEQLDDYDFLMKQFFNIHSSTTLARDQINARQLLGKDLTIKKGGEAPQILIYHTHSQEDFMGSEEGETITAAGSYLTELLQAKGYQVLHDTSEYDIQGGSLDRNKAYTYALEGITRILQENPSIEVVLDVHRDGVGKNVHLVHEINGKPTAQVMFFNGMSQTPDGPIEYLPNPYREDNLAMSLQMQIKAAAYFPGYTRKIYLKGLRYNMHLRPRSMLIEAGAQTNTYEEVKNAMEPLAELLDMVLQGN